MLYSVEQSFYCDLLKLSLFDSKICSLKTNRSDLESEVDGGVGGHGGVAFSATSVSLCWWSHLRTTAGAVRVALKGTPGGREEEEAEEKKSLVLSSCVLS